MKPEELFDPEKWPDDLKWVAAQHRLHPDDPVFLLLAWHWHRMAAAEDAVRVATVELKGAVKARMEELQEVAGKIEETRQTLMETRQELNAKPEEWRKELLGPLGVALAQVRELEKSLTPLARTFQEAKRRQQLATLLVGVALGALAAVIALVP